MNEDQTARIKAAIAAFCAHFPFRDAAADAADLCRETIDVPTEVFLRACKDVQYRTQVFNVGGEVVKRCSEIQAAATPIHGVVVPWVPGVDWARVLKYGKSLRDTDPCFSADDMRSIYEDLGLRWPPQRPGENGDACAEPC